MGKDSGKLTARQNAFVAEYLVDLNATQAAIRAGYSKATASSIGAENLRKPQVALVIEEALARRASRTELKADDVLRELWRLGTSDLGEAFDKDGRLKPIHEIPEGARRALSGIETDELFDSDGEGGKVQTGLSRKVKLWDKPKALEMLGRHFGILGDKDPPPVTVNVAMAPEWQGLRAELLTVLKRHPAALADVVVLLSAKSGQTVTVATGASRALDAVVVEPS